MTNESSGILFFSRFRFLFHLLFLIHFFFIIFFSLRYRWVNVCVHLVLVHFMKFNFLRHTQNDEKRWKQKMKRKEKRHFHIVSYLTLSKRRQFYVSLYMSIAGEGVLIYTKYAVIILPPFFQATFLPASLWLLSCIPFIFTAYICNVRSMYTRTFDLNFMCVSAC